MTTDTLTHDVHGTKVRYQLNKTANDTKFMTIENGPQGPQGATRALYITVFFLYAGDWIARGAHTRARLDRQQTVFSILNHIYLQTMNKWHFFRHKEKIFIYNAIQRKVDSKQRQRKPHLDKERDKHTPTQNFSHHEDILLLLETKLILNVINDQVKVHCCSSFLTTLSGHSIVSCWSLKSFHLSPFGA